MFRGVSFIGGNPSLCTQDMLKEESPLLCDLGMRVGHSIHFEVKSHLSEAAEVDG